MIAVKEKRDTLSKVLGVGALFSGAALVVHIVVGVSLPITLALSTSLLVTAVALVWRRAPADRRRVLARVAGVGLLSGLLATLAYDLAKFLLSQWDPSPYNPFEAIRTFGTLLVGPSASTAVVMGTGTAFHMLNGVCFGIGYCFLFGRRGIAAGIGWGICLELCQLTLYPGWLDIRAYREFAQISALSHLVYGSVLGAACRYGLSRTLPIRS